MIDTPVHAEQCNHEFLMSIKMWPGSWQKQPDSCAPAGSETILTRYENGVQYYHDGLKWQMSHISFATIPLHCTYEQWAAAHALG